MKRLMILLTVLLLASPASVFADWTVDGESYSTRKKITVPDSSLSDNITNALIYLPITADTDIGVNTNSDGRDIRITKSDGSTVCEQWKQSYVVDGGSLTAIIWFTAPLTDGQANDFYIYYDDDSGISDSDDSAAIGTAIGAVGWWPLNEASGDAIDRAGSNDGTLAGDTTQGAEGKIGTAYSFDGDVDYVDMGDVDEVDGLSQLGISFWYKHVTGTPSANQNLVNKFDSFGYNLGTFRVFMTDERRLYCQVCYGGNNHQEIYYSMPNTADWHHVTGVYNGTNVLLYTDSTYRGSSGALEGSLNSVSTPLYIGSGYNDGTPIGSWDGSIDDVMIFSRALTSDEISWNHTNQNSATGTIEWGSEEAPPAAGGGQVIIIPMW